MKTHTEPPALKPGDHIHITEDCITAARKGLFDFLYTREQEAGCSCSGLYVDARYVEDKAGGALPVLIVRHFEGCPRLGRGERSRWRL